MWSELIVFGICGAKDKIQKFYLHLLGILCLPREQALRNKIRCALQAVLHAGGVRLLYMSNLWIIRLEYIVFSFVTQIVLPLCDLFLPPL